MGDATWAPNYNLGMTKPVLITVEDVFGLTEQHDVLEEKTNYWSSEMYYEQRGTDTQGLNGRGPDPSNDSVEPDPTGSKPWILCSNGERGIATFQFEDESCSPPAPHRSAAPSESVQHVPGTRTLEQVTQELVAARGADRAPLIQEYCLLARSSQSDKVPAPTHDFER